MSIAVTIGTVVKTKEIYRGSITTAMLNIPIEIKKNTAKSGSPDDIKKPDFKIISRNNHEIGAGWYAKMKEGMDYCSINCRIADPSFDILRFSTGRISGQDDDELYGLIWNAPDS